MIEKEDIVIRGLTFDDVLILPNYSRLRPEDIVSTETSLCKGIKIKTPFISAAMDTVTESAMAIMMARNGGIGIIHRNCSIEKQCSQVTQVKRHQGNMVTNPAVLYPNHTMEEAFKLRDTFGFTTIPIVTSDHDLLGLITESDFDSCKDPKQKVQELMIGFKDIVVAYKDTTFDEAAQIMQKKRKKRLPIVVSDKDKTLVGIYFKKDIKSKEMYPHMSVDKDGKLLVGGAIGVADEGYIRAKNLIEAGVDVLCIDTAQGDSIGVVEILQKLKKEFPYIPIIAGNVVTRKGAHRLVHAGADAIKVGVGPGAICTTREATGVGCPQLAAIIEVSTVTRHEGVPLIADGGIKTPGDIVKALAAGADTVMMGSVFAGTDEAPGELLEEATGKYKVYRGMGSPEAMKESGGIGNDRYGSSKVVKKIAEGVSGKVPYKGLVQGIIDTYLSGLTQALRTYLGARDLVELRQFAEFTSQTQLGRNESNTRVQHM